MDIRLIRPGLKKAFLAPVGVKRYETDKTDTIITIDEVLYCLIVTISESFTHKHYKNIISDLYNHQTEIRLQDATDIDIIEKNLYLNMPFKGNIEPKTDEEQFKILADHYHEFFKRICKEISEEKHAKGFGHLSKKFNCKFDKELTISLESMRRYTLLINMLFDLYSESIAIHQNVAMAKHMVTEQQVKNPRLHSRPISFQIVEPKWTIKKNIYWIPDKTSEPFQHIDSYNIGEQLQILMINLTFFNSKIKFLLQLTGNEWWKEFQEKTTTILQILQAFVQTIPK